MAISYTFTVNWASGSDSVPGSRVVTGDSETRNDLYVSNSVSGDPTAIVLTLSLLRGFHIQSPRDVEMLLKPSNQTFALKADKPFAWDVDSYITCPYNSNVTEIQFTNTCGTAADGIKMRHLYNSP